MAKKTAPVPGAPVKWTKLKETAFLEHLSLSSNVAASERVADVPVGAAYRRRNASPVFRRNWELALKDGYSRLEHAMLDRALNGTPVVVVARDGTETHRIEYSERTAMALLAAHRGSVAAIKSADEEAGATERLADMLARMGRRLVRED